MNPQIESAKRDFEQTVGRLTKSLESTGDDKLNWSPSPTARTPLEIGFHAATVIAILHGSLDGTSPMTSMSTAEIDAWCRQEEAKHGSRDEVMAMIAANSAGFAAWLESLDDAKLNEVWHSPFGDIPYFVAISLPTYHTSGHVAQLEYIQTIYGDRVWH